MPKFLWFPVNKRENCETWIFGIVNILYVFHMAIPIIISSPIVSFMNKESRTYTSRWCYWHNCFGYHQIPHPEIPQIQQTKYNHRNDLTRRHKGIRLQNQIQHHMQPHWQCGHFDKTRRHHLCNDRRQCCRNILPRWYDNPKRLVRDHHLHRHVYPKPLLYNYRVANRWLEDVYHKWVDAKLTRSVGTAAELAVVAKTAMIAMMPVNLKLWYVKSQLSFHSRSTYNISSIRERSASFMLVDYIGGG